MTTSKSECNCDIDTICVKCGVPSQPVETHSDMLVESGIEKSEKIKNYWKHWYNEPARKDRSDETIADFWLKIISSQRKELIENIEGMQRDLVKGEMAPPHTPERCLSYGLHLLKKAGHKEHEIGAQVQILSEVLNLIKNND